MINKFQKIIASVMAVICCTSGMTVINVGADNSVDYVMGDVDADGKFTIADVTLFQRWLTGKDVTLDNWKAVDFCEDGVLNVFDLCMMKSELLTYNSSEEYPVKNPIVIDEFKPCIINENEYFDTWHIRVYIKHQYSVPERVWTIDDFQGVENIWSIRQYETESPYRQSLIIGMKNPLSKENVLKLIHDIEALELPEIWYIDVCVTGLGDIEKEYVGDVPHYIDN